MVMLHKWGMSVGDTPSDVFVDLFPNISPLIGCSDALDNFLRR